MMSARSHLRDVDQRTCESYTVADCGVAVAGGTTGMSELRYKFVTHFDSHEHNFELMGSLELIFEVYGT
jgi:hypothetical protein